MKTVHLNKESPSVGDLLAMARKKSVLLVSPDGASFVLEEADEFDREVAELGNSARFMRFLKKRSAERAVTSIEQFAGELAPKLHFTAKPLRTRSLRKKNRSARRS
ncbi:MAG: hypothetical protein HY651_14040 [Acidobacteria bacterium]|nr:hypothetical protein [Acidobacteriota bacterium]